MVQTGEPSARPQLKFGENMRITVAASQGGRRYMEDRCVVHTERGDHGELLWTFVGVFDGHGGEHASEYVRRHLLMNITKNHKFESDEDEDILEAIRQGFLVTHEQMRHVYEEWPYTASGYPSTAGTTVSCVFIRDGKLYTGHVGDSAIFLGTVENGDLHAQPLTVDHKPESAHEQMRIAKAGGETAVKSGVTRVVWKRPQKGHQTGPLRRNTPIETIPFLSVARSLGDLWSYNEQTNMFIVSPEPDLGIHRLAGNDFCLVLASDGMTNVLSGEAAVSIVFKEEEYVEMNEQINRNHARCVLRTALQKWRSLRADNVTVATVIFDIEQYAYQDNEILIKLGRYVNASQALSDRQDAMLAVSRKENVLLTTQRTPVIYNGSKDQNFCRVLYRGPGFRTHEEEIVEERRNLALKCSDSNNSFGNSSFGVRKGDEENVEYDDEDDEDVRDEPSEEVELSVRFNDDSKTVTLIPSPPRPPRPHAPMPVFVNEEEEEGDSEPASTSSGPDSESTKHFKGTPSKTPPAPTVRRVKAEAVRRLRTPKISASTSSPERRVTRSASRNACKPEEMVVLKTPSPQKRSKDLLTTPEVTVTPRRSTRLNGAMCTPVATADLSLIGVNGSAARLTMSRKRVHSNSSTTYSHSRITMVSSTTGITPVVSTLSLINSKITTTTTTDAAPSRSAPTTPKKSTKSVSKWSLSKLDLARKEHGIVRVEEIADEEEGGADAEDVMREPPSKIRRFYGYMRKFIWGK